MGPMDQAQAQEAPAAEGEQAQGGGDIEAAIQQVGQGMSVLDAAFSNPESGVPDEALAMLRQAGQALGEALQIVSEGAGSAGAEPGGQSPAGSGQGTPFGPAQQA